ncbi:aspartyl protease family protein [Phenylobacterium immobile]|uniref:aspartyl protease family protein n=1 Tax=Phenylobacterium immobile TaxID=21 RepID=UPI000A43A81B|nr:aspartyl protease family protein [Phenylobacterium immobile]
MTTVIDRRTLALTLTGASLAACAAPQPFLINLADLARPPEALPGEATIATGLDDVGRITAKVMVQGRGPFDFVVDTGANRTVISTELALELGLSDGGLARVHGIAGAEQVGTVQRVDLQIDSMAARIEQAPLLPTARLGAAGLLGVDAMAGRRVILDFRRREMRMAPSGPGADLSAMGMRQRNTGALSTAAMRSTGVVAQGRYRFGQLVIVGADASGKKIMAFLDSGSQSTVGNMALFDRVNGAGQDLRGPPIETALISATGQRATGRFAVLPRLRLGGLNIAGLGAVFAPLHIFDLWDLAKQPSILIGVDVMSQFDAIELDYGRRRIVFYPDPLRERRVG